MFDDVGKGLATIFGGIIVIAVVSVIVGQKSQAPAAIQAASSAIAKIVQAAVSPASTNAANPVSNSQAVVSGNSFGGNWASMLPNLLTQ